MTDDDPVSVNPPLLELRDFNVEVAACRQRRIVELLWTVIPLVPSAEDTEDRGSAVFGWPEFVTSRIVRISSPEN